MSVSEGIGSGPKFLWTRSSTESEEDEDVDGGGIGVVDR